MRLTIKKVTKPQRLALKKLENTTYEVIPMADGRLCDMYHTGINVVTLESLREKGLIYCERIFLGGYTTTDLRVIK